MGIFKGKYGFSVSSFNGLQKHLSNIFSNINEDNITGLNSTNISVAIGAFGCNGTTGSTNLAVSADLSTALGSVSSSDLNRTNGLLNEIKDVLVTFGLAST